MIDLDKLKISAKYLNSFGLYSQSERQMFNVNGRTNEYVDALQQYDRAATPATILELISTIERYREALEFYSKETNWNYDCIHPSDYGGKDSSGGKRARTALNHGGEGG